MALKNIFKFKKEKPSTIKPSSSDTQPLHIDTDEQPPIPHHSSTSTSLTSSQSSLSNSTIYNHYLNLSNNPNIPKELIPIITLLNCQNSRIYISDELFLNVEHNDSNIEQNLDFIPVLGLIKGNQLILYSHTLDDFKPISIDLLEATLKISHDPNDHSFILTQSHKIAYHLKFHTLSPLQKWITAIKLSNYEYHRLNEAYTASLLSAKAITLSDVHVVLAESRYVVEEWCSIKFGKKGNWINCYCVIEPFDKGWKQNKKGSIKFYTSSRTTKRNLICSISTIDSCYAVYPNVELIGESSLIRLNGDVSVYNVGKNFDTPSRSGSVNNSPNLYNNGFDNVDSGVGSINKKSHHRKTSSISSLASTKSLKGLDITNTLLYILPKSHNGVKNFETLIRFLIPIYDSFQLYGRSKRLISDKTDTNSLLFGLPNLPHVEYLTLDDALGLVLDHWSSISLQNYEIDGDYFDFNELFNSKIKNYYNNDSKHQGFGDLQSSMIIDSKFENPILKFTNNRNSLLQGYESSTPTSPKYAFSISDLPINASRPNNSNLNQSFSNSNLNSYVNDYQHSRTNSYNFGGQIPIKNNNSNNITSNNQRLRSGSTNSQYSSYNNGVRFPNSGSNSNLRGIIDTNGNGVGHQGNRDSRTLSLSHSVIAAQQVFQKEEVHPVAA